VATEMRILARKSVLVFAAVAVAFFGERSFAQQQDPNKHKDFFEMSIEELMDVPIVVSAARQPQKIGELSVPVSAITTEDIHYSGLTNIPEILQFTPGMDVLKFNRFSYAVGVRGLHELASDRVQSLVDGRLMDNPIYGGPEYWNLPVFLEDIERIEIVRGPGGPAWGANAFTGVINVITKKPEDVLGWFGSSTITEFGDTYTHLRWAEKQGNWRWRTSVGYEDNKSSDDALDGGASYKSFQPLLNPLMDFDSFRARDFSRNWRFDSEAIYHASEMTEASFGAGYSHFESGDFEEMGYFPMEDIRSELVRSFAKIDHKFKDGSTGYLQWFGNFQNSDRPNYFHYITSENGLDGQFNFTPAEGHQTSIGGNFRWTHINTREGGTEEYDLPGKPYDEYSAGLFAIDRWQTTDRLTLEGQIRGDRYSETQTDWAGRLSALYGLDEQKEHVLRISAARAFRTPLIAIRRCTVQRLEVFPGTGIYAVNLLPAGKLDNEHTWSLEAGYTGKLADGLTLRTDTYYQRFERLIGGGMVAPTFYRLDNIDGGTSYGAECELSVIRKRGKLSAWYAYNHFETDQSGQFVRGMMPARHKAGLTGRLFLSDNWTFNCNYKFTDTTPASASVINAVGSSNRLDLTISKEIAAGKGELMFGVSDLLDKSHDPFIQSDTFTAHEKPGRMFFGRPQLRF